MDCNPTGKNTRVGCHFLAQEIFPTQRLNLSLLHRRWTLYHLSHQGSPTDHRDLDKQDVVLAPQGVCFRKGPTPLTVIQAGLQ